MWGGIERYERGGDAWDPCAQRGTGKPHLGDDGVEELTARKELKHQVENFLSLVALVHFDAAHEHALCGTR